MVPPLSKTTLDLWVYFISRNLCCEKAPRYSPKLFLQIELEDACVYLCRLGKMEKEQALGIGNRNVNPISALHKCCDLSYQLTSVTLICQLVTMPITHG